jgi:hypothetical protein
MTLSNLATIPAVQLEELRQGLDALSERIKAELENRATAELVALFRPGVPVYVPEVGFGVVKELHESLVQPGKIYYELDEDPDHIYASEPHKLQLA